MTVSVLGAADSTVDRRQGASDSSAVPIGVFDSGVGGISVLREIRRVLPRTPLVYLADTAHCPYGNRPSSFIQDRAVALTRHLVHDRQARAVVVACNTASVAALDVLRSTFPETPIVGMEPAVKPAVAATRSGVVGVLATTSTLAGDRFARLVERFATGVRVVTQPCPGLVEQVEAGHLDSPRTLDLLRTYLDPLLSAGADTIVLGCTHYPFLRDAIANLVGPDVALIDSGAAVARRTVQILAEHDFAASPHLSAAPRFLTTGDSATVQPVVAHLWGEDATVEHVGE